jgi:hypothetical protein
LILRIKVQETHLTLQEHDDDDDDDVSRTEFVTLLEFGTFISFPKKTFFTQSSACARKFCFQISGSPANCQ